MDASIAKRFMKQFLAGAHARNERAAAALAGDSPSEFFRELHTVAGDAALMGLEEIAAIARKAELAGKDWEAAKRRAAACDAERALCRDALDAVVAAVAALGAETSPSAGGATS